MNYYTRKNKQKHREKVKTKKKPQKITKFSCYSRSKHLELYMLFEGSIHRGVEQWLARQAHNLEAVGSNPIPATIENISLLKK